MQWPVYQRCIEIYMHFHFCFRPANASPVSLALFIGTALVFAMDHTFTKCVVVLVNNVISNRAHHPD